MNWICHIRRLGQFPGGNCRKHTCFAFPRRRVECFLLITVTGSDRGPCQVPTCQKQTQLVTEAAVSTAVSPVVHKESC